MQKWLGRFGENKYDLCGKKFELILITKSIIGLPVFRQANSIKVQNMPRMVAIALLITLIVSHEIRYKMKPTLRYVWEDLRVSPTQVPNNAHAYGFVERCGLTNITSQNVWRNNWTMELAKVKGDNKRQTQWHFLMDIIL